LNARTSPVDVSLPSTVRADLRGELMCEWCTREPATRFQRVRGSAFDHVDLCDECATGLRNCISRTLHRAASESEIADG
jgi:hypothetical protein